MKGDMRRKLGSKWRGNVCGRPGAGGGSFGRGNFGRGN